MVLDTPVDLRKLGIDAYVVAGLTDHICRGGPRTRRLSRSAASGSSC